MSEHDNTTPGENMPGDTTPGEEQTAPQRPMLRIVKGDPTPEEVAALVAVLAARSAAAGDHAPPTRRSEWASPERRMRPTLHPAPGAWRASAFPR